MNTERFEDRLLDRLTELDNARPAVDVRPATAHRPLSRRPAIVGPAVAAALVLTVVVGIGVAGRTSAPRPIPDGGGPAPVAVKPASYTLVKNADGSVTFTVHDLLDLSGATQALNAAGITGRVVTSTEDCTTGPNAVPIDPNDLYPPDTAHRKGSLEGSDTATFSSSDYPPGGGLLVSVSGDYEPRGSGTLNLLVVYLAYVDAGKIPQCVSWVDPGTGDFPVWPPRPRK